VRIQDSALVAASELSNRYIADRFLPDKAIDLVDEACSSLRIEIDSMPHELDVLTRRKMQLEIELTALAKDSEKGALERKSSINKELAELNEKITSLTGRWQTEKDSIQTIRSIKEETEQAKTEAELAERKGDLGRVAEIRHGKLPELERNLNIEKAHLQDLQQDGALLKEEVEPEDIAAIVSRWTGIPVTRMLESEMTKLLKMEERIHERVIGQDKAITSVADSVRRSRAGLQDPNRPVGKFIFLGPTGVGKTEVARSLAQFLFDDEKAMIRIDMSEFQEKHSVARLIGAPPGYVGYDEGGYLTESVRRRPYSVILFDEVEKAHPEVFNVLLQMLDDGRLTDGQGRTVDFTNTIVIMTSNLGSRYIVDADDMEDKTVQQNVMSEVKSFFSPEFLNRIDEIIIFNRLDKKDIKEIMTLQLKNLEGRLAKAGRIINVEESALDVLADEGYDPAFGARPVGRVIQHRLQNEIARKVLAGDFPENSTMRIFADGGGLKFESV
jgi:ATP-dependent Clp protease ATP-binding subunit ClpB